MTRTNRTPLRTLTPALKAIADLFQDGFAQIHHVGVTQALFAHGEIEQALVASKSISFFQRFVPLRNGMFALLADTYRRYFRLALAHASQTGEDPDIWAQSQLQPCVRAAREWILDWYILACDGESQSVRRVGSLPFVPGQTVSLSIPSTTPSLPPPTSWRAPSWLFGISLALFGVGVMKQQHVPARDSEEKLGEAHTRLLLKGTRRVFLWGLWATIETVRNEETAAASAIRVEAGNRQGRRGPNKRQG